MSTTKNYRRQHEELLSVAAELSSLLTLNDIENNSDSIMSCLRILFGKLTVHLSMEDISLYPKVLNSEDENLKSLAKAFIDEMGDIADVVKEFKAKWSQVSAIKENPDEFISEASGLLDALGNRINRENTELYKAIDEM